MTDVWLVMRNDGTSQEADESVDSVWTTSAAAHDRANSMVCPNGTRVEIHTLDAAVALGAGR